MWSKFYFAKRRVKLINEQYWLLGCYAMLYGRSLLTFLQNMSRLQPDFIESHSIRQFLVICKLSYWDECKAAQVLRLAVDTKIQYSLCVGYILENLNGRKICAWWLENTSPGNRGLSTPWLWLHSSAIGLIILFPGVVYNLSSVNFPSFSGHHPIDLWTPKADSPTFFKLCWLYCFLNLSNCIFYLEMSYMIFPSSMPDI